MTNWYTADPHFGHEGILRFCHRPFASVGEMDAAILANYRACVQPDDDFWILGDLCLGSRAKEDGYLRHLFDRLPGRRRHLVIGNHDRKAVCALPWDSIHDIAPIMDSGTPLTLCHYPMLTWNGARHGALQLFGHVHNNWKGSRNSVNVGVDVWDFLPMRVEDIRRRAETLPVNPSWDQVEPGAPL